MLLAGDIGATKTTLAFFSSHTGLGVPLEEETFPSGDFPSLEAVIAAYRAARRMPVTHAAFGVAGPVLEGRAHITNLGWQIEAAAVAQSLGLPAVTLFNDLEAVATAVPYLQPSDLHAIAAGVPRPDGAIAVLAPGTGLGEAFLTWDGVRYRAHATEGGHTGFAPRDALQVDLLQYLLRRLDSVSVEDVCSGRGIPTLYEFLRDSGRYQEPPWLADRLRITEDDTPAIMNAAFDPVRLCAICVATLDLFVSILAAEAGNLALKVLATGGVYLGGGIPPRILPALGSPRFRREFVGSGRMRHLLEQMPIQVITNPHCALLGAAHAGMAASV
jgi:glucokinase